MTELTLLFKDPHADIAYFATAMEEFHAWEPVMRVNGGIVMLTERTLLEALAALQNEGFDLDYDFEKITFEAK